MSPPFSEDTASHLGQGVELQDHNLWDLSDRNGTSFSVAQGAATDRAAPGGWASSPDIHTAARYSKERVCSTLVVEKVKNSRKIKH